MQHDRAIRELVVYFYPELFVKRIGFGCESDVFLGTDIYSHLKVKYFKYESDFCRHYFGIPLLLEALSDLGYSDYVDIPGIVAVNKELLAIVSPYISEQQRFDSKEFESSKLRAVTALLCAAGRVVTLTPEKIALKFNTQAHSMNALVEDFVFSGVDFSGDNLMFDGVRWWAIDF